MRARSVAAWATRAKSCASWTDPAASIAQPVVRACMTSLWSPKIDRAWVATVRAATWMTAGVSSPAILNMFGTIRSRPWDAVNVVPRAPFWSAPWRAPAAPASDCISTTSGTCAPQVRPAGRGPVVAVLRHRGRRRDRVDRDHLADRVGDAGGGLVAVQALVSLVHRCLQGPSGRVARVDGPVLRHRPATSSVSRGPVGATLPDGLEWQAQWALRPGPRRFGRPLGRRPAAARCGPVTARGPFGTVPPEPLWWRAMPAYPQAADRHKGAPPWMRPPSASDTRIEASSVAAPGRQPRSRSTTPSEERSPPVRTDRMVSPVLAHLERLHARHAADLSGELASYIPELAKADPATFGICVATVDGAVYEVGDTRQPFTLQSISKPLTYGLALADLGEAAVRARIGVEPTGDAFNAIALSPGRGIPLNPMVNAGAIAAAGLVGPTVERDAFDRILASYGDWCGRPLDVDEAVYRSERDTGHRNRAIAHLLRSTGALEGDPDDGGGPLLPPVLGPRGRPGPRAHRGDPRGRWAAPADRRPGRGSGGRPRDAERHGDLRHVRRRRGLAVRCRAAGQERRVRRDPRGAARPARDRRLLAAARPARQQRPRRGRLPRTGRRTRPASRRRRRTRAASRSVPVATSRRAARPGPGRRRRRPGWPTPARTCSCWNSRASSRSSSPRPWHGPWRSDRPCRGWCCSTSAGSAAWIVAPGRCWTASPRRWQRPAAGSRWPVEPTPWRVSGRHAPDAPSRPCGSRTSTPRSSGPRTTCSASTVSASNARPRSPWPTTSSSPVSRRTRWRGCVPWLDSRRWAAGEIVVRRGDPTDELFLLTAGEATASVDLVGGGRRRLSTVGAGSVLGELAFLSGDRRTADVVADGPLEGFVLSRDAFVELGLRGSGAQGRRAREPAADGRPGRPSDDRRGRGACGLTPAAERSERRIARLYGLDVGSIVSAPDTVPSTADVVIVGGGIAGASDAFFLGQAGLVRRGRRAWRATRRSDHGPVRRLLPGAVGRTRLRRPGPARASRSTATSRSGSGCPAGTSASAGAGGCSSPAPSPGRPTWPRSWRAIAASASTTPRRSTGDEARRRFGWLGPDVTAASYRADDGWVSPYEVTYGFARASGASFLLRTTATRLRHGRRCDHRRRNGSRHDRHAPGGPRGRPVLAPAWPRRPASTLPVAALRRHRAMIAPRPEIPADGPMTVDMDTHAYWRPEGGGAFLGHGPARGAERAGDRRPGGLDVPGRGDGCGRPPRPVLAGPRRSADRPRGLGRGGPVHGHRRRPTDHRADRRRRRPVHPRRRQRLGRRVRPGSRASAGGRGPRRRHGPGRPVPDRSPVASPVTPAGRSPTDVPPGGGSRWDPQAVVLPSAWPMSFTPMTRHRTAMITALLLAHPALHALQDGRRAVAEREVDDDRRGDADRGDERENGVGDRLLARRQARPGDRGRGAHGEQQVLRVEPGEERGGAEGLDRREESMAPIQAGVGAVSPSCGRLLNWRAATTRRRTPRTASSHGIQVAVSADPPAAPPRTPITRIPMTGRPMSQPMTNIGRSPAPAVTSMRITAMIGSGLRATPTAIGRT